MYKKRLILKGIEKIKNQIENIEQKRRRSEIAILDCIINKKEYDVEDIKYFNSYTAEIEVLREELESFEKALKRLEK